MSTSSPWGSRASWSRGNGSGLRSIAATFARAAHQPTTPMRAAPPASPTLTASVSLHSAARASRPEPRRASGACAATLSAGENAVREFRSFRWLNPLRRCCIKCNGESPGKPRGSSVEQTRSPKRSRRGSAPITRHANQANPIAAEQISNTRAYRPPVCVTRQ